MAHDRIEEIDAQIKYEMKDAAVATGIDGWRVTYKPATSRSTPSPPGTPACCGSAIRREKQS
jgi:hypothetical protein